MDEKFRTQLEENGADVKTTINRFMGKEELYLKFIMKFLEDKNMDSLLENLDKKDYDGVFNSAHSLKGVTGNLGLNPIYEAAARICDLLRGKKPEEVDVEKLQELKEQLTETYKRFQQLIENFKAGQ